MESTSAKTRGPATSTHCSVEDFNEKIKNLASRFQGLLKTYEEVLDVLPPPGRCKKLVEMDLRFNPEIKKQRLKSRQYLASAVQVEEIERQVQQCIDAWLLLEYNKGDYEGVGALASQPTNISDVLMELAFSL